ncbi:hypothetical protein D3C84_1058960 [compost metagenome]
MLFLGFVSLSIIVISFCIAILVTKNPNDAGRGGAIVVAMSFYFILRPDHHVHPRVPLDGQRHVKTLLEKEDNILLSFMSILGTLAWGFLDILAAKLI